MKEGEDGRTRMPLPENLSGPASGTGGGGKGAGRGGAPPADVDSDMKSDMGLGLGSLFPPRGGARSGGVPAPHKTQFSARGRRQANTNGHNGSGADAGGRGAAAAATAGGGGSLPPSLPSGSHSSSPPDDKSRGQSGVTSSVLSAEPTPREPHFGGDRKYSEESADAPGGTRGAGASKGIDSVQPTSYGPIGTVTHVPGHGHGRAGVMQMPANSSDLENMDSEELMMALSMRMPAGLPPAHQADRTVQSGEGAHATQFSHAPLPRSPRSVAPPEFWYLGDPLASTGAPGGAGQHIRPDMRPGHLPPTSAPPRPPSTADSTRSKGSKKTIGPGFLGAQQSAADDANSPSRNRIMSLHKQVPKS
jgi:hypothetical protein